MRYKTNHIQKEHVLLHIKAREATFDDEIFYNDDV